jgi:putative transposase
MARSARIQFHGALYHVLNRGIDRRDLFWDDRDRDYFLDSLALGVERFHVEVHAYCLMPNHYHLLVGTPLGNISHFMQSVQTRYAGHFNLRHNRSGYVFQGVYKAKLVEGDEYLLALSRYIHLNAVRLRKHEGRPVKDIACDLRRYPWSSFRGYIGRSKRKEWVTYSAVESHVKELMGRRRGAYREYVERGLVETDEELEALLRSGKGMVATDEFVRGVLGRKAKAERNGGAAFRSVSIYVPVEQVMQVVLEGLGVDRSVLHRRRGSAWVRGAAAEMLCVYAGLTQAAAARALGLGTGAAVCIRRKALAERCAADHDLDRALRRITKRLDCLLSTP